MEKGSNREEKKMKRANGNIECENEGHLTLSPGEERGQPVESSSIQTENLSDLEVPQLSCDHVNILAQKNFDGRFARQDHVIVNFDDGESKDLKMKSTVNHSAFSRCGEYLVILGRSHSSDPLCFVRKLNIRAGDSTEPVSITIEGGLIENIAVSSGGLHLVVLGDYCVTIFDLISGCTQLRKIDCPHGVPDDLDADGFALPQSWSSPDLHIYHGIRSFDVCSGAITGEFAFSNLGFCGQTPYFSNIRLSIDRTRFLLTGGRMIKDNGQGSVIAGGSFDPDVSCFFLIKSSKILVDAFFCDEEVSCIVDDESNTVVFGLSKDADLTIFQWEVSLKRSRTVGGGWKWKYSAQLKRQMPAFSSTSWNPWTDTRFHGYRGGYLFCCNCTSEGFATKKTTVSLIRLGSVEPPQERTFLRLKIGCPIVMSVPSQVVLL